MLCAPRGKERLRHELRKKLDDRIIYHEFRHVQTILCHLFAALKDRHFDHAAEPPHWFCIVVRFCKIRTLVLEANEMCATMRARRKWKTCTKNIFVRSYDEEEQPPDRKPVERGIEPMPNLSRQGQLVPDESKAYANPYESTSKCDLQHHRVRVSLPRPTSVPKSPK